MNTNTKLMQMADNKATVTGTYYGVKFAGKAESSRQLWWGPDYPEELTISLDAPITVYGEERARILIDARQVDDRTHRVEVA